MASLCREPFTKLHIRMDGSVYACSSGQLIGNLQLNSASELWNSKKILELRRQLTENDFDQVCLNCSLYDNKHSFSKNEGNTDFIDFKKIKKIKGDFYFNEKKISYISRAYGFVDIFKHSNDKSIIEGWVINKFENKPAGHVALLVNGSYFAHSIVNVERPDVCEGLRDEAILVCGVKLEISFIGAENKVSIAAFGVDGVFIGEIVI